MNNEQYYDKEIKTICNWCGNEDGEHFCACGADISSHQCTTHEAMCADCI